MLESESESEDGSFSVWQVLFGWILEDIFGDVFTSYSFPSSSPDSKGLNGAGDFLINSDPFESAANCWLGFHCLGSQLT